MHSRQWSYLGLEIGNLWSATVQQTRTTCFSCDGQLCGRLEYGPDENNNLWTILQWVHVAILQTQLMPGYNILWNPYATLLLKITWRSVTINVCISARACTQMLPFIGNGAIIPHVQLTKLLGVLIQSNLKWGGRVQTVVTKAKSREYCMLVLARAEMQLEDLVKCYSMFVRPIYWSMLPQCGTRVSPVIT